MRRRVLALGIAFGVGCGGAPAPNAETPPPASQAAAPTPTAAPRVSPVPPPPAIEPREALSDATRFAWTGLDEALEVAPTAQSAPDWAAYVEGRGEATAAVLDESTRRVDANAPHWHLEEVLSYALAARAYERIARRLPEAHPDAQVAALRARWIARAHDTYGHCETLARRHARFDALATYCAERGVGLMPSATPPPGPPAPPRPTVATPPFRVSATQAHHVDEFTSLARIRRALREPDFEGHVLEALGDAPLPAGWSLHRVRSPGAQELLLDTGRGLAVVAQLRGEELLEVDVQPTGGDAFVLTARSHGAEVEEAVVAQVAVTRAGHDTALVSMSARRRAPDAELPPLACVVDDAELVCRAAGGGHGTARAGLDAVRAMRPGSERGLNLQFRIQGPEEF